mgnify:CR=1 FL=1
MAPGVIFCLRHQNKTQEGSHLNPLHPYFLVYIREDGSVCFNYLHVKQILEIFRYLCQGRKSAYHELCDVWNEETENGMRMDKYKNLLNQAITEIQRIFKKRNTSQLFSHRDGKLVNKDKQIQGSSDFELITWLVIHSMN